MPYTNNLTETNTELYPWHTRGLQSPYQGAERFDKIQSLRRSIAIIIWTDNGAADPTPAAAGGVSRNKCSDSCGKGWQFMWVFDYARNPTPPSGELTMGRRDCVFMLYLRSTALWKLGMQHWLFSVNQYPGGPWKPHGFNLEHHRHWISEKRGLEAVMFCIRVTCVGCLGMFHVLQPQD